MSPPDEQPEHMTKLDMIQNYFTTTGSKIVMLVVDGLGGIRHPVSKKSELETANIPNLDLLAQVSACGVTIPVLPGVTPGSGPGHLALFGYDPIKNIIGRGALEAMGLADVDFKEGDIVARGNFCTIDNDGLLIDRRAGRINSTISEPLCHLLNSIKLPSIDTKVYPVKDYRFVLRMRGNKLSANLTEMDPQQNGVPLRSIQPSSTQAKLTAIAANDFVRQARTLLVEERQANMISLRGFSGMPHLTSLYDVYKLNAGAIAAYPMYKGLAAILGMKVLTTGSTFQNELATLIDKYHDHDFFFIHYKSADTAGEDGDFDAKVNALEQLDSFIPKILELNPDVMLVAGDHSTPSIMRGHSWHPVPLLISSRWTQGEGIEAFNERTCSQGSLGTIQAVNIMPLAMAHAGKLLKFGA